MVVSHRHILLLALLLASPTVARAAQTAEGTATAPRFEPAPCPKLPGAEELAKASCGYLVVPENRSRPTGRTIRLMVAKYPARSPEKLADPIVYLAGGPGDIAPLEVNALIAADFIRDRDIYVVSQRGTMFSEPALTCAAPTTSPESFLASASIPRRRSVRTWPRPRPATANSPPPGRPQRLQFDRERRRFRRPPQGARLRRMECLRDVLWIVRRADAHARPS